MTCTRERIQQKAMWQDSGKLNSAFTTSILIKPGDSILIHTARPKDTLI